MIKIRPKKNIRIKIKIKLNKIMHFKSSSFLGIHITIYNIMLFDKKIPITNFFMQQFVLYK